MTTNYENTISSLNPQVWFKFDAASGTPANSGASTNVAISLTSGTPVANRPSGVSKTCYFFNGSTDGYQMDSGAFTSNTFADGNFTIEAWIKTNAATGIRTIFQMDHSSAQNSTYDGGWALRLDAGKAQAYYIPRTGATFRQITDTANIADDNWHHVVMTVNSYVDLSVNKFDLKLYVDGVLKVQSTNNAGNTPGSSSDSISFARKRIAYSLNNTEYFSGNIDELAIYTQTLNESTILNNYNARSSANDVYGPLTNQISNLSPVIWYKFDEAPSTTFPINYGSRSIAFTQTGGGTSGVASTVSGASWSFDAVGDFILGLTTAASSNQLTGMTDGVFSIEFWIKANTISTSTNQVIWNLLNKNDSNRLLAFYIRGTGLSNTGKLTYFTLRSGGSYQETITTSRVDDNKWHHIVIAQNGNTTRFYVDGNLETTKTNWSWTTFTWDNNSGVEQLVGAGYTSNYISTTDRYLGGIDELVIYPTELNQSQVSTNYLSADMHAIFNVNEFSTNGLFVDPLISGTANTTAQALEASAEFASATTSINVNFNALPMEASANSGDHKVIHLHFRNFVRTDYFNEGVDGYYTFTEIHEQNGNQNYYTDANQYILTIAKTANSHNKHVLFKPYLNNLTSSDIHSVHMVVAGMNNITTRLIWSKITQAFNLNTVTWNTKPTATITQDDNVSYQFFANETPVSIDITDLYKHLTANANFGFELELKDLGSIDWNLAGYGVNLEIYTYSQPIDVDISAAPMNVDLATMPDSLIDATSTVSVAWLPAETSALFVNPTLSYDKNLSILEFTASAEIVDATIVASSLFNQTSMTASSEFLNPTVGFSSIKLVSFMEASAEFTPPSISTDFIYIQDHITVFAESGDHEVQISEILFADPYLGNAEFVEPSVGIFIVISAAPAFATMSNNAPVVKLGVNMLVDPFISSAAFEETIISTVTNTSILVASKNISALFIDPVISAESVFNALAATATAEIINPSIEVTEILLVDPFIASGILVMPMIAADAVHFADPAIALAISPDAEGGIWDGYAAEVMEATARITIRTEARTFGRNNSNVQQYQETQVFEPYGFTALGLSRTVPDYTNVEEWRNDYLSFNRWASPWHNIGSRIQADATYPLPFTLLNLTPVTADLQSSTATPIDNIDYGPGGDNTHYALKNISSYADSNFVTVGRNTTDYSTTVNPINNKSIRLPHIYLEDNVGNTTTYLPPSNLCKGFHYEFLIKPSVATCILASGGAISKERSEGYVTEIRLENNKLIFEYVIFDVNTYEKKKRYLLTSTNNVPLNEWSHLTVQTNLNDGFYQQPFGDGQRDVSYKVLDPISLNNDKFLSVELFINGNIDAKTSIDFPELLSDTQTTSIGLIQMLGRRFGNTNAGQAGTGQIVLTEESTDRNLDFQGTWGGTLWSWTQTVNNRMIGGSTNDFQDRVVTFSAKDVKRMSQLALGIPLRFADSATANAVMVEPQITTNTKKVLRLYWFAEDANNEMFGVNTNNHNIVTYSVRNKVSTDNDVLFNADKAFAGGNANPETASAEVIVDAWRNQAGYKRFINLQTDIEEYQDIDAIVFMDYPDDSVESSELIPGYAPQWVSDQYDAFISSLKTAMQNGKSLFVSSAKLAKDLKIVKAIQEVSQEVEAFVNPIDPFKDDLGDTHYDASRNNKYRIVGLEDDLTTVPSFIMTDVISHTGDISDDYHIKYANRPNGLNLGDKLIIPSLPLTPSQLVRDTAGDTSNRIAQNTLEVFNESDVLAGKIIAKLGDTNYVTTIILEPGDILDGEVIKSKIIVNCVEDGLAMGLEEYNYGKMQIVSVNDDNEDPTTIQWQYSTSRTTKQLDEVKSISSNLNTYGQTYPSQGGGGGIVQAPTHSSGENIRTKFDQSKNTFASGIYYDVESEKFDIETIPVYSMTYRGINWLLNPTDRTGTFVGDSSALAQAEFKNPTTLAVIVDPLPAVNKTVNASPMTANGVIVTNIKALFGNANSIVLTLHHQDVITLYISKERL